MFILPYPSYTSVPDPWGALVIAFWFPSPSNSRAQYTPPWTFVAGGYIAPMSSHVRGEKSQDLTLTFQLEVANVRKDSEGGTGIVARHCSEISTMS